MTTAEEPTVTNAAGQLSLQSALVRGVTVANGLRGLMDLDASNQPGDLVGTWRGTAVASALGQLAATVSGSSAQLLRSCCGVAKQRNSLTGIEAIFLSALLGTADGAAELDLADATWSALPSPRISGDVLVPTIDPMTGELCFLATHDLAGMSGLAMRAQLVALRQSRAHSPGSRADQFAFGAAVLQAASSVMSATVLALQPDTAPEKADAVAALQPVGGGSGGLALALARGAALIVQTQLLDNPTTPTPVPAGWRSVWPQIGGLSPGESPRDTLAHPYWRASQLCPARPIVGPGLTGQMLVRQNGIFVQSIPRVAFDGAVLSQGCYPEPAPDIKTGGTWRTAVVMGPGSSTRRGALVAQNPHVDTTTIKIIGGVPIDPLTGNPVDPLTGLPLPGHDGGGSSADSVRRSLVDTVQTAQLATATPVGDVISRIVGADYDL